MGKDSQRSCHPNRDGNNEGRGNCKAINEVVKCVADQEQRAGVGVRFAFRVVTMPPDDDLLKQKEGQDSRQRCRKDRHRRGEIKSVVEKS